LLLRAGFQECTDEMAKGKLDFLSKDEIERIHSTSMRVLAEVGVVVHSRAVTKMLIEAGASQSKDGRRLLIPENLVKGCLSDAPKSIILAGRDEATDMKLPSPNRMYVANGGEGIYIKDLLTGATRPSTTDDVRDFMILIESLPQIDFAWGMVGALDQPTHLKNIAELRTAFAYTSKHIQGGAASTEEAIQAIRMASVFTGGTEGLAKKPVMSSVCCPISPLAFEDGLSEAQVEFAKAGVPIVSMSAAVAGLTSPVTISGTVAQVNAENLASLVMTQVAKKGAPWIYSSDSCPGDLRTGSIDYGAVEAQLMRTAAAQMGRHYGLPVMAAGIGIENTSLDLSSVREGIPYMMLMALVPSDLGSGFGGLDQAAGAAFEQMIVDAWIWDSAREFIREFDADHGAIGFDLIREAGIDGNFLGKRHTLTRFKKEFIATSKPEAVFSGRVNRTERGAVVKKAKKEAERILKENRGPVASKDELRAMDEIVARVKSA
jgi:trimethylamine--corrinoid protein Co-methyltransferase